MLPAFHDPDNRPINLRVSDTVGFESYDTASNSINFYPILGTHIGDSTLKITLSLECNGNIGSSYSIKINVINKPLAYENSAFKYPDISLPVNLMKTVIIPKIIDPEGYTK